MHFVPFHRDRRLRAHLKCATSLVSVALTGALALHAAPAGAERVGVASAVNPDATGQPPGQPLHVINVGGEMVHDERIRTGPDGRTQLLFLDGSALTIGPNSDIVLDDFVYDPETKSGTIALNATKGLFRFVGGKISKKGGVSIKTPTALIGIRGGIGIISITPAAQSGERRGNGLASGAGGSDDVQLTQAPPPPITSARLGFGEMTINTGGGQQVITRPGFQVIIVDPDLPPPPPAPGQGTESEQAGLEGSGQNSGGASQQPTNEDVAGTQLADLGSQNQPGNLTGPGQARGPGPDSGPANDPNTVEGKADPNLAQQNAALDDQAGVSGGQRMSSATNFNVYSGRYLSQTPFSAFDFNTGVTTPITTRNQGYGAGVQVSGYFAAGLNGGIILLPAMTGSFSFAGTSTLSPFGAVSGTGFGASDQSFFYWNLQETAHGNNPASIFAGVPYTGTLPTTGVSAYSLTPGFPGNSTISALPKDYGGNITGALNEMIYVAWSANTTSFPNDNRTTALFGSIAIEGTGSSQRSAMATFIGTIFGDSFTDNKPILSGYSRGSVRNSATGTPLRVDGGLGTTSKDSSGNAFFGLTGPDHFVLGSDFTSGTGQISPGAGFVQTLENTAVQAASFFSESYASAASAGSVGTTRTTRTINGFASGIAAAKSGASVIPAYIFENMNRDPSNFSISTNATTNRASGSAYLTDFSETRSDVLIPLGSLTGNHRARSAFIDDDVFGLRESPTTSVTFGSSDTGTARLGLLSSAFFNTSSTVASGTTFCSCTHTKWGFMSGEVRKSDFSERQRFHLAPWVAGELGSPTIIAAMTGTATYSGHVVANIMNGTAQYVDTGNLSQTWNFSSRTGSVTISDLDGATYTASLSAKAGTNGSQFSGTLSSGMRTGNYYGAFMKNSTDQAGELGSAFNAIDNGHSYYVAGIGVAKKN